MSPLEDALREALARREPPAGFDQRLMSRIASEGDRSRPHNRHTRRWALAAAVLLAGLGLQQAHRQREIHRGEVAKQRLVTALEIASSKLQHAQKRVLEIADR